MIIKHLLIIFIIVFMSLPRFVFSQNAFDTYANKDKTDLSYTYLLFHEIAVKSNGVKRDSLITELFNNLRSHILDKGQSEYLIFLEEMNRRADGWISEELYSLFEDIYDKHPQMVLDFMYVFKARGDFLKDLMIESLYVKVYYAKKPSTELINTINQLKQFVMKYSDDKSKKKYYDKLVFEVRDRLNKAVE